MAVPPAPPAPTVTGIAPTLNGPNEVEDANGLAV